MEGIKFGWSRSLLVPQEKELQKGKPRKKKNMVDPRRGGWRGGKEEN